MRKRIISCLIASTILFSITACKGTGKSSSASNASVNSSTSTDNQSSQAQSPTNTPEGKSDKTPFERFSAALDDAKYSYESVVMGAELVGAKSGIKYKFDFGKVELYQFEDDSEALTKAIADNGLTLEGFGVFPCKFNGNLAILIDVTENEDNLLSLFNAL